MASGSRCHSIRCHWWIQFRLWLFAAFATGNRSNFSSYNSFFSTASAATLPSLDTMQPGLLKLTSAPFPIKQPTDTRFASNSETYSSWLRVTSFTTPLATRLQPDIFGHQILPLHFKYLPFIVPAHNRTRYNVYNSKFFLWAIPETLLLIQDSL